MDILAGRTTRAMKGEAFSQSAVGEVGILDCLENGAGTCRNVDYIETLEAERDAALAEVVRLREALELAAQFVAKAHADGAYNNTAMSGDRALRIINVALGHE